MLFAKCGSYLGSLLAGAAVVLFAMAFAFIFGTFELRKNESLVTNRRNLSAADDGLLQKQQHRPFYFFV
jgi:hypothetical protein